MDRRIQLFLVGGIILINTIAYSQCSDSIKVFNIDSCKMVQTSLESFNNIYKYKPAFKELSAIVDSLKATNEAIDLSFSNEVKTLSEQKKEIDEEFIDCENEKSYLMRENKHLKKQRGIYSVLGVVIGVLFTIILM